MARLQLDISEELLQFGADIIELSDILSAKKINLSIVNQLLRSGTSVGANYEEACGAESKADFIHKLHLSYKELKETNYWLRLIRKSRRIEGNSIEPIILKSELLLNVLGKSLVTCKQNKR